MIAARRRLERELRGEDLVLLCEKYRKDRRDVVPTLHLVPPELGPPPCALDEIGIAPRVTNWFSVPNSAVHEPSSVPYFWPRVGRPSSELSLRYSPCFPGVSV